MRIIVWILLLIPSIGFTQEFIPFLAAGNEWHVDTKYCPFEPPYDEWIITHQLTMGAEIEVDGQWYTQIMENDNPTCLLREEDGRLYKYVQGQGELIMIDMNMEVGQLLDVFNSGWGLKDQSCGQWSSSWFSEYLEVVEVSTENIAGADRKVIHLVDPDATWEEDMYWIEGIGTYAGLIMTWPLLDLSCYNQLACFKTNGETYFFFNSTSCDNTTLGTDELSITSAFVYPHPIESRSILQLDTNAIGSTLEVYSLSGKLHLSQIMDTDRYVLDAMNFGAGLYVFRLIDEQGTTQTGKFIVR